MNHPITAVKQFVHEVKAGYHRPAWDKRVLLVGDGLAAQEAAVVWRYFQGYCSHDLKTGPVWRQHVNRATHCLNLGRHEPQSDPSHQLASDRKQLSLMLFTARVQYLMYANHNRELSSPEVALVERYFPSAIKAEEQSVGIRLSLDFSARFWRNFFADDPFYGGGGSLREYGSGNSIKSAYHELDLLMKVEPLVHYHWPGHGSHIIIPDTRTRDCHNVALTLINDIGMGIDVDQEISSWVWVGTYYQKLVVLTIVESVISVYWPAQSSHMTDNQTRTRRSNIHHFALTLVKELEAVKFVVEPAQSGVLRNEYHGMVDCGMRLFGEVERQYHDPARKGPAIGYALGAAAGMSIQLITDQITTFWGNHDAPAPPERVALLAKSIAGTLLASREDHWHRFGMILLQIERRLVEHVRALEHGH